MRQRHIEQHNSTSFSCLPLPPVPRPIRSQSSWGLCWWLPSSIDVGVHRPGLLLKPLGSEWWACRVTMWHTIINSNTLAQKQKAYQGTAKQETWARSFSVAADETGQPCPQSGLVEPAHYIITQYFSKMPPFDVICSDLSVGHFL